ncbi:hypothetical protein [Kamptonema formosum]|uniref:hypothetical protein n=1 Tax=Kamptonema formosum TaxID=331992 RepID=UPI0012DEC4C3|nr:hypothetical protein [Oscillatoria sp. PCC 10802]
MTAAITAKGAGHLGRALLSERPVCVQYLATRARSTQSLCCAVLCCAVLNALRHQRLGQQNPGIVAGVFARVLNALRHQRYVGHRRGKGFKSVLNALRHQRLGQTHLHST